MSSRAPFTWMRICCSEWRTHLVRDDADDDVLVAQHQRPAAVPWRRVGTVHEHAPEAPAAVERPIRHLQALRAEGEPQHLHGVGLVEGVHLLLCRDAQRRLQVRGPHDLIRQRARHDGDVGGPTESPDVRLELLAAHPREVQVHGGRVGDDVGRRHDVQDGEPIAADDIPHGHQETAARATPRSGVRSGRETSWLTAVVVMRTMARSAATDAVLLLMAVVYVSTVLGYGALVIIVIHDLSNSFTHSFTKWHGVVG